MNPAELLVELRRRGVVLTAECERLWFDAPAGAMTADMRQALAASKPAILALLALPEELVVLMARAADDEARADLMYRWHERAGIVEHDGGMDRPEAEWTALALLLVERRERR